MKPGGAVATYNNYVRGGLKPFPITATTPEGQYLYAKSQPAWPTNWNKLSAEAKKYVASSSRTTLFEALPHVFDGNAGSDEQTKSAVSTSNGSRSKTGFQAAR